MQALYYYPDLVPSRILGLCLQGKRIKNAVIARTSGTRHSGRHLAGIQSSFDNNNSSIYVIPEIINREYGVICE